MSVSHRLWTRHLHTILKYNVDGKQKLNHLNVNSVIIRNFSKRGIGKKGRKRPRPSKSQLEWARIVQNCTRIVQTTTQRQQQQKFDDSAYRQKIKQKQKQLNLNGKRATTNTVPEHQQTKFREMLLDLRNNPSMDRLEMPPDLTKSERTVLHKFAMQLDLSAKSLGKGDRRRIVISRKTAGPARETEANDLNLPELDIGMPGVSALDKYMRFYPPTGAEIQLAEGSLVERKIETGLSPLRHREGEGIGVQQKGWNFMNSFKDFMNLNGDATRSTSSHGTSETNDTRLQPRKVVNLHRRAELYKKAQKAKENNFRYQKMQNMRVKLPAYQYQNDICNTIQSNRVTILAGETGCGKSTQVPQFILDSFEGPLCKIAVTQPRRISAISLAERVASERCERVGRTVGHSVRMDTSASEATQLLFLTPGVLLRKFHSDPELDEFTHIIIDEIHERDKHTEFLMIVLKELMKRRKDLHVILMSATLQTDELNRYWSIAGSEGEGLVLDGDDSPSCVPANISIPGRTFPLETFYLEDILRMTGAFGNHEGNLTSDENNLEDEEMLNQYQMMHDIEQVDKDLIVETIKFINKSCHGDGAILVFLPGWQEISEMMRLLDDTHPFSNQDKFLVLPLHSGIPSKEQKLVFKRPRKGVRKVILSTNIAETSVTIDDVAFVIDSGRAKEKNYDPDLQASTLQPAWISQASAKQRRGRAGRTQAGLCFHLFSRSQHDLFRKYLESELLRTSLEEICLQCKKLGLTPGGTKDGDGIPAFLNAALSPPHRKSVANALESLVELGAMDSETNLTCLGHCLSRLSVEPKLGKMIVWGYILGCSKDAIAMAVGMSNKSPFVLPPPAMRRDAEEAKIDISQDTESDQVTILKVLEVLDGFREQGMEKHFFDFCRSNFINVAAIEMISDLRQNIARELSAIGYIDPAEMKDWHNRNGSGPNLAFLQSAIVAGVFPNVASRQERARYFGTAMNQLCKIHRSSVNGSFRQPLSSKKGQKMHQLVAYGEMIKGVGAHYTINQTTRVSSVLPILLLCGEFTIRPAYSIGKNGKEELDNVVISVDGLISVQCDRQTASTLTLLRKRLDLIFQHIISDPQRGFDGLTQMEKNTLLVLDAVMKSSFDQSSST